MATEMAAAAPELTVEALDTVERQLTTSRESGRFGTTISRNRNREPPGALLFVSLYDQIFKPSKFPANADFHLFRAGVEPKWEDPDCANGGKWTVTSSKKTNLDEMWLETLMALIGEQLDEAVEICGVVASVRQRQDKVSLWTKNAAIEAAQMDIGRKWKEIIDATGKISYNFHDDSKRERSAKNRYSV